MSQCPLACGRQKPVSCWRTPLPPQGSLKKPQNPSSLTDDVSCRGLWLDRLFPWTHSLQKHLLSMPTCKGHLSRQGMKKPADSIRTSRAGLIPGRAAQTGCDARGASWCRTQAAGTHGRLLCCLCGLEEERTCTWGSGSLRDRLC